MKWARTRGGYADLVAWARQAGAVDPAHAQRLLAEARRRPREAAELLTSRAEVGRVRVCGLHDTHECSWLFMDMTSARTRRWCSMTSSGSKAKAPARRCR